jgi:uncharacterized delta-60 repeat protein
MAINLSDNIKINAPKPIESKYLNVTIPYTSISEVNSCIPIGERHIGLVVNINNSNYWYGTGVTDGSLVSINNDIIINEDQVTNLPEDLISLQDQIYNLNAVQTTTIYYFENTPSDIPTYEGLVTLPQTISGVSESVSINGSTSVFDAYATPLGIPNVNEIPAGLWIFHTHAQFSSTTGLNYIHWDAYKRTSGGTETLLFRASTSDINTTALVEYQVEMIYSAITMNYSDRLVVRILAETTGGGKTATVYYSGVDNFGFIQPPLTTNVSPQWNSIVNKPLWLTGQTLSAFENDHSHSQYELLSNFNTYTGNTENRLENIENDILIISGLTGNLITGATNGLSIVDSNVVLGGTLTGDTTIDLNNKLLDFTNQTIPFIIGNLFNDSVTSIAIQNDNKILVSGVFTTYSGVTANRIIRLNTDGSIDNTFNSGSGFDNNVNLITIQSDNKILIGGDFTSYSGVTANRIIRLNTDGIIDNTFNTGSGFDNDVRSIAIQDDNKILVGGLNFVTYSGVTANRIIRLNTDGSIDNTFNSGSGFNNGVLSIAIQDDNKILIGGYFTSYSGVTANTIIRLNTDGSIDNTFNSGSGFDDGVRSIAIQDDNKILVVGLSFTTYSGVTANRIIRLNSDASIDNTFNSGSGFNYSVNSIAIQSDNKILVGGSFTTYSGVTANSIIRLNTDGSVDDTFNSGSGFNNPIYFMTIQSDNKILIGGYFTSYSGVSANYFIRLNTDGSIDTQQYNYTFEFNNNTLSVPNLITSGFTLSNGSQGDGYVLESNNYGNASWVSISGLISGLTGTTINATNGLSLIDSNVVLGGTLTGDTYIDLNNDFFKFIDQMIPFNFGGGFDGKVSSIIIQSDNKILIGGYFTSYSGVSANRIIRLYSDGIIDNTFNTGSGFDNDIYSVAIQSDNKILVGGGFTTYSGVSANYIIRLNTDGSIDNTFNSGSGFNLNVNSIAIQSDNKILIGGNFTTYSGVSANHFIRLNTDGSIDNTFNSGSGFNNSIYSVAIQSDNKILAGGYFISYSGVTANRIIRLNSDGSIDNTFNSGSGFNLNLISSIVIQSDNKILVGGGFTTYSGVSANYIIRLNTDGSIDNTFNSGSGFDNDIYSVAIQSDNKILIGGNFTTYSGVSANHFIRLNTDGSIDNTFNTGSGFNFNVNSITIRSDNKILAGGYFTTYSGVSANHFIRLNSDGSIDTQQYNYSFEFNNDTLSVPNLITSGFTLSNGSQGDGYLLGSDINGNASWISISGLTGTTINATNGLSIVGNDVVLGGTLTDETIIDVVSYGFNLSDDIGNNYFGHYSGWTGIFHYDGINSSGFDSYACGCIQIANEFNNYINIITMGGDFNKGICLYSYFSGCLDTYINILSGSTLFGSGIPTYVGAQYDNDYSSNFVDRSLIDKGYLISQISGLTINATNGLTLIDSNVVLGGTLTDVTTIDTATNNFIISGDTNMIIDINGSEISIGDYNGDGNHNIYIDSTIAGMYQDDGADSGGVEVTFGCSVISTTKNNATYSVNLGGLNEIARISATSGSTQSALCIKYNEMIFSTISPINFQGVKYDNDYSSNFVARSIPDVAWVTGLTITANNGLTKIGQNVVLGGTLTGDTTINTNDNTFSIFDSNSFGAVFTPNSVILGDYNDEYHAIYMLNTHIDLYSQDISTGDCSSEVAICEDSLFFGSSILSCINNNGCFNCSGILFNSNNYNTDSSSLYLNNNGVICLQGSSTSHFICMDSTNDTIELTTFNGGNIYLSGDSVSFNGTLKILLYPVNGTLNDSVLTWNATDFQIKKIDLNNIIFKNNIYLYSSITTSVLLTTGDSYIILVNPSTSITITLPSTPLDGQAYKIKDISGTALTNIITIDANGSTIDGSSTVAINTNYGTIELFYTNSVGAWSILSFLY